MSWPAAATIRPGRTRAGGAASAGPMSRARPTRWRFGSRRRWRWRWRIDGVAAGRGHGAVIHLFEGVIRRSSMALPVLSVRALPEHRDILQNVADLLKRGQA